MSYDPPSEMECTENLLVGIRDTLNLKLDREGRIIMSDAYWLRELSGRIMQAFMSQMTHGYDHEAKARESVLIASTILTAIKAIEGEK